MVLGLIVITILNMVYCLKIINNVGSVYALVQTKSYLYAKFPNEKFHIYDYKYKQYSSSLGLSLLIAHDGRQSKDGRKIGISCYGKGCPYQHKRIYSKYLLIDDLENVKESDLNRKKQIWISVNQESTYDDLIGWLNKNNLKSSFNLNNYIMEKLNK
jgi:hypothetical protein